jgi:hypothetical protein
MRKILPRAYGGYSEDKIFRITQISGKLAIYGWALDNRFFFTTEDHSGQKAATKPVSGFIRIEIGIAIEIETL